MSLVPLIIGLVLIGIGVAMPIVGIVDVAHDTQSLIAVMTFLAGAICLAISGRKD